MILNKHRLAGFTLLELLIAMSLLGLILALLFGGMRLGARSWDAGEMHAENSTHLALLQGFLRRELSQVTPFHWKKKADMNLAFIGEPDNIKMVAPIAVRLGAGGLFLISLELAQDNDFGQLVMKRAIPVADSVDFTALENVEKIVLAEHVQEVSFAYFGAETKDAEPQWQDQWGNKDSQQHLPYLIRVRVKFSNGRVWPDLVVAPVIGSDTGCVWDSSISRCVSG
ncbi:Type II secretion system protein J [Candidatus Nitrotoga sp. BS]|uniref:prepilin-type N-terminal cleavage/methylation domain-containing protein n=1 Tax=Candidatus Nitrotoga sp. BS TaxID=2890408 RepID=UPI001EF1651E|nr:prepilin-type N-terminal cleavage/methylation domain-containing protein [Candidatus Nitrotoga sp. BS]CAH1191098.1 Type II secretion system protein J [Candidatus Nitrotoga sp. BS]